MNEITSEYDIDSAWSSFCEDGNIDNDILNNNIPDIEVIMPRKSFLNLL